MSKRITKYHLNKISELSDIFDIIEIIGGGSFGTVYRAIHLRSDETKALKISSKYDSSNKTKFHQEIKILSMINHPNIISLEAVYESMKKICLVFEYCPRELSKVVRGENFLNEASVQRIMQYLTSAVAYLHSKRIVHRDIKLENILLGENPKNPKDAWFVKLCDFSVSALQTGKGYETMLNDFCGTPLYMAPEMETKSYSEECDIWALGVIMFLLFQGSFPYPIRSPDQIFNVISQTCIEFSSIKCSRSAAQLIQDCLQVNPALRITAQEMLHSPWIRGKHSKDNKFSSNVLVMMDEYNDLKFRHPSKSLVRSQSQNSIYTRASMLGGLPETKIKQNSLGGYDEYPKVKVSAMTKDNYHSSRSLDSGQRRW